MSNQNNKNNNKDIQRNNNNSVNDPIYYNLSLNAGLDNESDSGAYTIATFTELNNSPILFDSGDWYISVMRCSIPTINIPRYIFPIETGSTQNNINLAHNFFSFRYVNGVDQSGNYSFIDLPNLNDYTLNVNFKSELINPFPVGQNPFFSLPFPPSQYPPNTSTDPTKPTPKGQQDLTGYYYYIYVIESLVNMFNYTLKTLWATYISIWNPLYPGTQLPPNIEPYYTFDAVTGLWSFNAEKNFFCQTQNNDTSFVPFIAVFCDNLTNSNTFCPNKYDVSSKPDANGNNAIILLQVNNLNNNNFTNTINSADYTFLKNTANMSSISSLACFQKIIFEISGDVLVKYNEVESLASNFQKTNLSQYTQQKPTVNMLVDFEVNKEEWANNSAFIQFQASSFEEVRLISLAQKSTIQNFTLNIYWLDTYGNRHPLLIPSVGNPLTVKIAFFNKNFKK